MPKQNYSANLCKKCAYVVTCPNSVISICIYIQRLLTHLL